MNLVADVGGSNARFALADRTGRLSEPVTVPSADDLAPLIGSYLQSHGLPVIERFACAAAGPVGVGGRIALTNRALSLDLAALRLASGAREVRLINDFAALAHALPLLGDADRWHCGGGAAVPDAPRAVLGPGTGLGMAITLPLGGRWWVLPGEGGHADLAPADDREAAAWQALRRQHGRVSAETVLCGPGLLRLYAALGGAAPATPAELDRRAEAGEPLAVETRRLFTRWLGRVAGNLALTVDARGGVYIGGGIVPCWQQRFDSAEFRRGFEDKPPMRDRLAAIPTWVITHPHPALLGLARWVAAD